LKIRIDYREKDSGLIDLLKAMDLYVEIGRLSYGDYIINEAITIERKTARDFLISIIDGRLFRQLANLKKKCPRPLLLIEGDPYATDLAFDPSAIKGALLSVQVIWYVPIILSDSKEATRDIFLMIGGQEESGLEVAHLRGGYRPKKLKSRQLYLLQGLPGIGPRIAKRLLDHFGSVIKVMNASAAELREVEGIGRLSAQGIRQVLDQEAVSENTGKVEAIIVPDELSIRELEELRKLPGESC
jgi:Fanconi anemia group M protein